MEQGILEASRLLKKRPIDSRDRIFNMNGIEISGITLERRIEVVFLQREMDPFVRFKDQMESDHIPQAALYRMSSKAGSFTVSNAAFVEFSLIWIALQPCRGRGSLAGSRERDQEGLLVAPDRAQPESMERL